MVHTFYPRRRQFECVLFRFSFLFFFSFFHHRPTHECKLQTKHIHARTQTPIAVPHGTTSCVESGWHEKNHHQNIHGLRNSGALHNIGARINLNREWPGVVIKKANTSALTCCEVYRCVLKFEDNFFFF